MLHISLSFLIELIIKTIGRNIADAMDIFESLNCIIEKFSDMAHCTIFFRGRQCYNLVGTFAYVLDKNT